MQSSKRCFKLFLLLMLLLAAITLIEGRGGGGRGGGGGVGRRGGGGGFFNRGKSKKTSYSTREQRNGRGQVSGSLGSSVANKPLKSVTQSKPQTPLNVNIQQLLAGFVDLASRISLPQGATNHSHGYHGSGVLNGGAIPAGGIFYANATALPPNAQSPSSTFSPGNFLNGMNAAHMLGQGLFGHRSYALHAQHGNNEQHQDNNGKVVTTVTSKQDCYPATSLAEESVSTKSPDSVVGNISSDRETMRTEQMQAVFAAIGSLEKYVEKARKDFFNQFQHETVREFREE